MDQREAKSCYLISVDKTLQSVYLPHKKSIILGRCPETGITNTQCSKEQVLLYADYQKYTVTVQQLGKQSCGFNGFKTVKENKYVGKHDYRLEMLYGKYAYQIEFNPPPPKTVVEKRTREPDENEVRGQSKMAKFDANDAGTSHREAQNKKNAQGILKYMLTKGTCRDLDESEQSTWESIESGSLLIYTTKDVEARSKIAAYDLDGTLIKSKSGLVFPKNPDDWQLIYPTVPAKLKQLHSDGYKIVIFTNQASIGSGRLSAKHFLYKIKNITQRIGVPMQIFVATTNDKYRKPMIGMWQRLEQKNDLVSIDKDNSFFVGDAAGRATNWAHGKKKDHSSADRLLALNLSLKFQTPEEHFLNQKPAPFTLPVFNPRQISNTDVCPGTSITSSNQEIVLMVGCPGSGKSHFVKNYLKDYGYVNRDTLGSWQKCIAAMESHITQKISVVIDNTNPDRSARKRYIDIGTKYKVPIRCFVMTTTVEHAKHNNKFRELTDPTHAKVTDVIIDTYMKNYEQPSLTEGFAEIVNVNFVPKFQKDEHRQIYEMYLLEK